MTRLHELKTQLHDDLNVCCGQTDDVLLHMLQVLRVFRARSDTFDKPSSDKEAKEAYDKTYAELDALLGLSDPSRVAVAHVYLYHLDSADMIEHGSGIRGSWITERGRRTLASLEEWAELREKEAKQ